MYALQFHLPQRTLILPAYQRAILDGRSPTPFAWESRFASDFLDNMWEQGIKVVTHRLLPECPSEFGHTQISLTETELQRVFEKFDFSALLFRRKHKHIFPYLFDLFEWLVSDVSDPPIIFNC